MRGVELLLRRFGLLPVPAYWELSVAGPHAHAQRCFFGTPSSPSSAGEDTHPHAPLAPAYWVFISCRQMGLENVTMVGFFEALFLAYPACWSCNLNTQEQNRADITFDDVADVPHTIVWEQIPKPDGLEQYARSNIIILPAQVMFEFLSPVSPTDRG